MAHCFNCGGKKTEGRRRGVHLRGCTHVPGMRRGGGCELLRQVPVRRTGARVPVQSDWPCTRANSTPLRTLASSRAARLSALRPLVAVMSGLVYIGGKITTTGGRAKKKKKTAGERHAGERWQTFRNVGTHRLGILKSIMKCAGVVILAWVYCRTNSV